MDPVQTVLVIITVGVFASGVLLLLCLWLEGDKKADIPREK